MAWSAPKTWASEPLTASDMNTHIRDNFLAVKEPPSYHYATDALYSTTSTSFVDMDAVNLAPSVEIAGSSLRVRLCASFYPSANQRALGLQIVVDGVVKHVAEHYITYASFGMVVTLDAWITGLSPGSRTVKIQWKTSGATMSKASGHSLDFSVREEG